MGVELLEDSTPVSYTESFYEQFPFYLSIGMTYEQYWNGDCLLPKYYRKAHKLKNEQLNQELWLQGMYIYDALCRVAPALHAFSKSPKPMPYPERPYSLNVKEINKEKEEKEKNNRERAKAMFHAWASRLKLPKKKEVSANVNDD